MVTASDSRTPGKDLSGALIRERADCAPATAWSRAVLVADDAGALRAAVARRWPRPAVDVVVVTGGTGLAPRDVTIEAIAPLFEKSVDGFGELFRRLSYDEIGAAAMLSRATAGVAAGKAVFLLPGSPAAVRLAIEEVDPARARPPARPGAARALTDPRRSALASPRPRKIRADEQQQDRAEGGHDQAVAVEAAEAAEAEEGGEEAAEVGAGDARRRVSGGSRSGPCRAGRSGRAAPAARPSTSQRKPFIIANSGMVASWRGVGRTSESLRA